jgi:hypothetical protein
MKTALAIMDRIQGGMVNGVYIDESSQGAAVTNGDCMARLAFTGTVNDLRGIGVLACTTIHRGTHITCYGGEYTDGDSLRNRNAPFTHVRRSADGGSGMVWDGYVLAQAIHTIASMNDIREADEIVKAMAERRSIYIKTATINHYKLSTDQVEALKRCGVGFMVNGTTNRSTANVSIGYKQVPLGSGAGRELKNTVLTIVARKDIGMHEELLCYYGT